MILNKDRIPKPFSQNIYINGKLTESVGSCVACTIVGIIEVLNSIATGKYIELSKGYFYVRNNSQNKKKPGMNEEIALEKSKIKGSVPIEMCSDYGEFPEIANIINDNKNIIKLDKIAERYAISDYVKITGTSTSIFQKIKIYLDCYNIPLIGITTKLGEPHAVPIIGYESDNILWQDHDGTNTIKRSKHTSFKKAYRIEGLKMQKFTDIDKHWAKQYIEKLASLGILNGYEDGTFRPDYPVTRAQIAKIICDLIEIEKGEKK